MCASDSTRVRRESVCVCCSICRADHVCSAVPARPSHGSFATAVVCWAASRRLPRLPVPVAPLPPTGVRACQAARRAWPLATSESGCPATPFRLHQPRPRRCHRSTICQWHRDPRPAPASVRHYHSLPWASAVHQWHDGIRLESDGSHVRGTVPGLGSCWSLSLELESLTSTGRLPVSGS